MSGCQPKYSRRQPQHDQCNWASVPDRQYVQERRSNHADECRKEERGEQKERVHVEADFRPAAR